MFISSSPGSSNSVVVRNLSPLTAYTIRMRAENELGKSEYSREITVTTTIEGNVMFLFCPPFCVGGTSSQTERVD